MSNYYLGSGYLLKLYKNILAEEYIALTEEISKDVDKNFINRLYNLTFDDYKECSEFIIAMALEAKEIGKDSIRLINCMEAYLIYLEQIDDVKSLRLDITFPLCLLDLESDDPIYKCIDKLNEIIIESFDIEKSMYIALNNYVNVDSDIASELEGYVNYSYIKKIDKICNDMMPVFKEFNYKINNTTE